MRNLAIARAGEDSKHETWLSDPARKNFDLLVAYYGDEPGKWRSGADVYDHAKGLKYPWAHAFLSANPWVFEYDAVLISDDDLQADTATVVDLFDIFAERGLWLAQPAMSRTSECGWEGTRVVPNLLLRHVGQIEEGAPVFSGSTLRKLWSTFGESVSGWGLSPVWEKLLAAPEDKVAVVDAAPFRHGRPCGTGEMYTRVLPSLGINAGAEMTAMLGRHGVRARYAVSTAAVPLDEADPRTPARRARQGVA